MSSCKCGGTALVARKRDSQLGNLIESLLRVGNGAFLRSICLPARSASVDTASHYQWHPLRIEIKQLASSADW